MNTIKIKNIAELKTRKGTPESTVEVLGYYVEGDGGGGNFYWDNVSTETDNSGTIIQVTGVITGRWKRVYTNVVNVRWFGAKGDGVTSDTTTILNAINSLTTGGTLYFPSGTYLITGSNNILTDGINIGVSNIQLIGDKNTILKQASSSFYALSINNNNGGTSNVANNIKNIKIDNLQFVGTVDVDGFSEFRHLLNVHAVTNLTVENCTFKGFRGDGFMIGSSNTAAVERHNKNIKILNCTFDGVNNDNRNAISVIDVDGLTIERCEFENCTRSNMPGAIDIEPDDFAFHITKNIKISNNKFKNIGGNLGIISYFGAPLMTEKLSNLIISENTVDTCIHTGAGISVITRTPAISTSTDNQVKILNNKVNSAPQALFITSVKNCTIDGNVISNCTRGCTLSYINEYDKCFDIKFDNNVLLNLGQTSAIGLSIFSVNKLSIKGNRFTDCYGYAIDFNLGTSDYVSIQDNIIESPTVGRTTVAIQKEVAHTFTPKNNYYYLNKTNGLLSNFAAYLTDDDTLANVYTTANVPTDFPIGRSIAIVNGVGTPPDSKTQGKLITEKYVTATGYSNWITQFFYPRDSGTTFYIRSSTSTDTTWTSWFKYTGVTV
jgi:hypothetical protein